MLDERTRHLDHTLDRISCRWQHVEAPAEVGEAVCEQRVEQRLFGGEVVGQRLLARPTARATSRTLSAATPSRDITAGTRLTESFDAERPLGTAMTWITEKWVGSHDRDADLHAGMVTTLERVKNAAETGS